MADLALSLAPTPRRVLDVGSGTGYLLGLLAARLPGAEELTGVDAAPAMVAVARANAADGRVRFAAGLAECARVTAAGFRSSRWHRVYAVIIQAVTAVR